MRKIIEIPLSPQLVFGDGRLVQSFARALRVDKTDIRGIRILKRSVDLRSKNIWVRVLAEVFINEPFIDKPIQRNYPNVSDKHRVIVVGTGPAGLFAALKLIENGFKPIVLERGKNVSGRKKDIAALNREQKVNPDSNYCFGEGGAGTFSDGKLYTRSTKRGNVGSILETLVWHGANPDILIDNHPHIGTDKLPAVIERMRESILKAGGEIHFECRVSDLIIREGSLLGVIDQHGKSYQAKAVILATGHSARDIYELLEKNEVSLEFKPFAVGFRIEHPQELIDSIQYKSKTRPRFLPAASYSLVAQAEGRGVFSFCMCPGGTIVPSATAPDQVVVNGMSNSRRNSAFANSGIVVSMEESDLGKYPFTGALKGLQFQEMIENYAFQAGGSCQKAPAQRLVDFMAEKTSAHLPDSSYFPGLTPYPLHQLLPSFITERLRIAFQQFDSKMRGYISESAVLTGVESRTSSPVRIPRDPQSLEHLHLKNLYPCGEGAGYSGGIVSSAIDGERVAQSIVDRFSGKETKRL